MRKCFLLQYWVYNDYKELKTEGILCVDVVHSSKSTKMKAMKCHEELAGQEWRFTVVRTVVYLRYISVS